MEVINIISNNGDSRYRSSVKRFFNLMLTDEENIKNEINRLYNRYHDGTESQRSTIKDGIRKEFAKDYNYEDDIDKVLNLLAEKNITSMEELVETYDQINDNKLFILFNIGYGNGAIAAYFNNYKRQLNKNQITYWSYFTGKDNQFYNLFKEQQFVSLTWTGIKDISKMDKNAINNYIKATDNDWNEKGTTQVFNDFINEVKSGDIFVLKQTGSKIATLVEIIGECYYVDSVENERLSNRYDIKILLEDVELDIYYQKTLNKINKVDYQEMINELLSGENLNKIIGTNKIWAGAPGTGKSYYINQQLKKQDEFVTRVTFHPEYEYHNFIGSILPITDNNQINYQFVPGPFTETLCNALNDPNNHYYLVIEEMTRGNCAAIFGDIFQLLDRDTNGKSQYPITNLQLKGYLKNLVEDKIYIPENLSIYGTINTSDQNVYPMDTAFKRRFNFEYISVNQNQEHINPELNFLDQNWAKFYLKLNNYLLENLQLSEDKQLGPFFINNSNENQKVIMYLWQDIIGHFRNPRDLFQSNITTLDKALNCTTAKELFTDNFNDFIEEIAIDE